jgi:hypothetical protein
MKFRVFLRLLIGGRGYGDRLRIFRRYCCDLIEQSPREFGPPQPDEDLTTADGREAMMQRLVCFYVENGLIESAYRLYHRDFANWRQWKAKQQRRAAATSRWEKVRDKQSKVDKAKSHQK